MALLYSVTEYYSSVWKGSAHCRLIDNELLRKGLRIITGTVKSTKLLQNNPFLSIHENRVAMPKLKSRYPFLARLGIINFVEMFSQTCERKNGKVTS